MKVRHELYTCTGILGLALTVSGAALADSDTDDDGLLDTWETGMVNGNNLKVRGTDPKHADAIVVISRFEDVDSAKLAPEMDKAKRFFAGLDVPNPDGRKGINLIIVNGPPVKKADYKAFWWTNRDKYMPKSWKGIAHWMQATIAGGGQADFGAGGQFGGDWASFVHEYGHVLGLSHEGGPQDNHFKPAWNPLYPSLMNYAYGYSFNGDPNQIRYSDGRFRRHTMKESELTEILPFPIDQVKFLQNDPYRFRLQARGAETLIDWNRNGTLGETQVRADINYGGGSSLGERHRVAEATTSPALVNNQNRLFVLYGYKPGSRRDLSTANPGVLRIRRVLRSGVEGDAKTIVGAGVIGDPVAVSLGGNIHVYYPTTSGIEARVVTVSGHDVDVSGAALLPGTAGFEAAAAVYKDRIYVFLWNPVTGDLQYRATSNSAMFDPAVALPIRSTIPVGAAANTKTGELILGLAQNQDAGRKSRWQIRRYAAFAGKLTESGPMDWVEGPGGQSAGRDRCTILIEDGSDAGPTGRIHFFARGFVAKDKESTMVYDAHQVGDKSFNGGWLVKPLYDVWTETRSAPSAVWLDNDIAYAFRWTGNRDHTNDLNVSFNGLGIQDERMGDFNDLEYIRQRGLKESLQKVRRDQRLAFRVNN